MSLEIGYYDFSDWDDFKWAGPIEEDLLTQIKNPRSRVFRRAFVKRKQL